MKRNLRRTTTLNQSESGRKGNNGVSKKFPRSQERKKERKKVRKKEMRYNG